MKIHRFVTVNRVGVFLKYLTRCTIHDGIVANTVSIYYYVSEELYRQFRIRFASKNVE